MTMMLTRGLAAHWCPWAARVWATLIEKEATFEMRCVDINHPTEPRLLRQSEKPQWFLKLNPLGKVRECKHPVV